jgi:pimeloyl-ACP methyl ester carboxylesterase
MNHFFSSTPIPLMHGWARRASWLLTFFVLGLTPGIFPSPLSAQAPKEYLEASAPRPQTKVVKLTYTNPLDQSVGEALLELPPKLNRPTPLIISPHGANWTPEMNRAIWTGVADDFNVMILNPQSQGKVAPGVSLGSPRQMSNLEAALAETRRRYPVDKNRIYACGISQGGIETLMLVGQHPQLFAAAVAINPIADFLAMHEDSAQFRTLLDVDFGGTPDTARAEYYLRSPFFYAHALATVPLILYWAENDELIPQGERHQGGMLAKLIRAFQPKAFEEVRHAQGHGYPFFAVDVVNKKVVTFPRGPFLESVKKMLRYSRRHATAGAPQK